MATVVPPKRGVAFAFEISLVSQADTDIFKTTVTLAAGDIQVSKDGGQFANLATFPPAELDLASGADSGVLSVTLTAAEMAADRVVVHFHDQAGAEWQDAEVEIFTSTRQVDDLAYPTVSGRSIDVDPDGGVEVDTIQAGGIVNAAFALGAISEDVIAANSITSSELADSAAEKIADAVWDALTAGLVAAGSIGKLLVDRIDAAISSRLAAAGYTAPPTVGQIADQVWDELLAGHLGAGSTGEALDDAASGASPAAIADQVWDEATAGHGTAGTFGDLVVDKLALITTGSVSVVGPVAEGGNVVTYRGDSYRNADGRALDWESEDWPDLTGATIAVIIERVASFAGSVVTPIGPPAVVRLELTAAQSATITAGRHNFQVVASLGAQRFTLVAAAWVSRARASA